ncbi:MAG: MSMEG_0570 family nitrogen starvation response protein [Polyangia bacterium]
MPEMHFVVRWPDGGESRCYSPSLIVREYLQVGCTYPLPEFMQRSRTMLNIGSERVRAKYGYACSAAMDQLHELESRAAVFAPEQQITVTAFELPQGV